MKRVLLIVVAILLSLFLGTVALALPTAPQYDFTVSHQIYTASSDTEMASLVFDSGTYYLFYHYWVGTPSWVIGVATSSTQFGPWSKAANNPIIDKSPALGTFSLLPIKIGSQWWGVYGGGDGSVYLAQPDLSGDLSKDWHDYSGTPILTSFGYIQGIGYVDGQYRIYGNYPVDVNDLAPFVMASAPAITGPWTKYSGNPLVDYGATGSWWRYGFTGTNPTLHDGYYHAFLAGAPSVTPVRDNNIGYAYSTDGTTFVMGSSLVTPESVGFRYFSETYTYVSPCPRSVSLFSVYSTIAPPIAPVEPENIGVTVFSANGSRYSTQVDVSPYLTTLTAGETFLLSRASVIHLASTTTTSVFVSATYNAGATQGVKIHWYTSADGGTYTENTTHASVLPFIAGQTVQTVIDMRQMGFGTSFIRIVPENLDLGQSVTNVQISIRINKGL